MGGVAIATMVAATQTVTPYISKASKSTFIIFAESNLYTTYNIQRGQDVINPSTPHQDIMMLATTSDTDDDYPFLYAHMLGIYHANVIYAADLTQTYQAKQFEFLWV